MKINNKNNEMNKDKEKIFPINKHTKYPIHIIIRFIKLINKKVLNWLLEKYFKI